MPKIRTYDSQVRPSGRLRVSQPAAGRKEQALQYLGGALTNVAEFLVRKREQDASLWVEKTVAESRGIWDQRMQVLQDQAGPGAPEFTQRILDEYEDWRTKTLENAPTERSRSMLDADLTRQRSVLAGNALQFERTQAAALSVNTTLGVISTNNNAVRANPGLLEDVLAQNTRLIEGIEVVADVKAKMLRDQENNVAFAAINGELDRVEDPEDAQAILEELRESKDWQRRLSESGYAQSIARAMRMSEQLGAQVEKEFTESFGERIRELEFGTDNGLSEAEIRANVADTRKADQMAERLAWARETGAVVTSMKSATPADRQRMVAEVAAKLSTAGDFDAEMHALQVRQRAYEQVENAIATDPAAYAMRVNEKVNEAYARLANDPTPEAAHGYAIAAKAEQERLRGPGTAPNLLPKTYLAAFAQTMAGIERTPEGAEQAHGRLMQEATRWGKHWPEVYDQLAREKVISGAEAVAARLSNPEQWAAGQRLLVAAAMGEKELKKRIDLPAIDTELKSQVLGALSEFRATLPPDFIVGARDAYRQTEDAVRLLALSYTAGGLDLGKAVERAANEIILNQYRFSGTYRVPKAVPAGSVDRGANAVKRGIDGYEFVLPLSGLDEKTTRDASVSALRENGIWVTNADESGLQLLWPNGAAVQVADGDYVRPLSFTWAELQAAAPARTFPELRAAP